MMKALLTYTIFCFLSCVTLAQDKSPAPEKSHLFSLNTGFSKYIGRDDAMSPFIYRGTALPVEICYRYSGPKNRHTFYANLDNLKLKPDLPDFEKAGLNHYVQNINMQIEYSYVHKAFSIPEYKTEIFLGGGINSLINLRMHAYINDNEYLMLDQFNSLAFKTQIEKRSADNKQIATINLTIPFVSYVLMSGTYNAFVGDKIDPLMDYGGNMLFYLLKKGEFVSFGNLAYVKSEISYTRFLSNHIGIGCKYSFRYYRFTQYKNLNYSVNLQNSLMVGLIVKI